MEREFWHLGTVEQCLQKITLNPGETVDEAAKREAEIKSKIENKPSYMDPVFFTDGITIEGHVWVPLESFSEKLQIPREYMLTDGFLELIQGIYKRDGVFPIKKMDI